MVEAIDKQVMEGFAERALPGMQIKSHGPVRNSNQPNVWEVHFDCWSTTNLTWFDEEMKQPKEEMVQILSQRTKDALKDMAELWFSGSHQLLDPEFLVATSPALRKYIGHCVQEGYFPHEEHGCSTPTAPTT